MQNPTRRSVLAALGAGFATAGCLSADAPGRGTTDTTTDVPPDSSPSPDGTGDSDTPTPSGGGITHGAEEPSADHAVLLSNQGPSEQTVRVRVVRTAGDEVVFDATLAVGPDSEREVYNLEQADPEGIEAFSICGEIVAAAADDPDTPTGDGTHGGSPTDGGPRAACETIRTSACYGDAIVTVAADGALQVVYAVC